MYGSRVRVVPRRLLAGLSLAVAVVTAAGAHSAYADATRPHLRYRSWGYNGTTSPATTTPTAPSPDNAEWSQIAAGGYQTVGLKHDGTVWQWGVAGTTPAQVAGLANIKEVAAGFYHGLAIDNRGTPSNTADDTLLAWSVDDGRGGAAGNQYGQLGHGTTNPSTTPVQVKDTTGTGVLTGVTRIGAGLYHSLAVVQNALGVQQGYSWGDNEFGQLGNGLSGEGIFSTLPGPVVGEGGSGVLSNVKKLVGGRMHSLALKEDGNTRSWGGNDFGQLCLGPLSPGGPQSIEPFPKTIPPMQNVTDIAVAAGGFHSLFLKSNKQVYACGFNALGQLGDGCDVNVEPAQNPCQDKYSPVPVKRKLSSGSVVNLTNVVAIAAGGFFSLAIDGKGTTQTADDTALAWGDNGYGQLGNGTTTASSLAVDVSNPSGILTGVTQLAGGYLHTGALAP